MEGEKKPKTTTKELWGERGPPSSHHYPQELSSSSGGGRLPTPAEPQQRTPLLWGSALSWCGKLWEHLWSFSTCGRKATAAT